MKTISKKIKTIYLLAIMAILSVCVAVFPVFKTETVKAESAIGLSMTGAELKLSEKNGSKDFALMFQAEITKDWYDTVATEGANVKFGMAIGPKAQLSSVTSFEQLDDISDGTTGNAWIYTSLVGTATSEANQLVEFEEGADTFTYEAGTHYSKIDYEEGQVSDAQWLTVYATELMAIPFYSVDRTVNFDATINYSTSPKQEALDTYLAESALPVDSPERTITDGAFKAITGMAMEKWYNGSSYEIYLSQEEKTYSTTTSVYFFTNFIVGAVQYSNNNFLRVWGPYRSMLSSKGYLGVGAHFAGTSMTTACTNNTDLNACNLSTRVADYNAVKSLIPGETYRFYYYVAPGQESSTVNTTETSVVSALDGNTMYYFEYKVVTNVFGGLNGAQTSVSNFVQGSNIIVNDIYKLESSSSSTTSSYFYLRRSGKDLVMPYSATQKGYENGYDGYYILAGDIITPNNKIDGTQYKTNSNATATTALYKGNVVNTNNLATKSIGALKEVPTYTNNMNSALLNYGFTGTFDGRGYTINASFSRGGLFGHINGGTVKNLNVKADFYHYDSAGITQDSYMEKAAVLAEVIEGATIENVVIELEENATATYAKKATKLDGNIETEIEAPEMDNVPGIIASQPIERSTLKNVIVKCDSLKDVGKSIQNYRAALNLDNSSVENVFVIGSSYSNMRMKTVAIDETTSYELITLSASPDGFVIGQEYPVVENADALGDYYGMIEDMYKWLRNANLADLDVRVMFIGEPATGKFASDTDFQAWLNGDGATAKTALIGTGMWKENDETHELVWAKKPTAGTLSDKNKGTTYVVVTSSSAALSIPEADSSANPFGWTDFTSYSARVVFG